MNRLIGVRETASIHRRRNYAQKLASIPEEDHGKFKYKMHKNLDGALRHLFYT
jgi:hypothetical protein